jgi:hypothetical protein
MVELPGTEAQDTHQVQRVRMIGIERQRLLGRRAGREALRRAGLPV